MKYLLDTCGVAEIVRSQRNRGFEHWAASVRHEDIFLSTVTVFETYTGIFQLPSGRRRDGLYDMIRQYFNVVGILSLDAEEAELAARIGATERAAGRTLKMADACIAATALYHGLTLVTHDRDFAGIPSHADFADLRPTAIDLD